MAKECHGAYSFIPVAPNVGTVFVNTVAGVLSTFTQGATLRLLPAPNAKFAGPLLGDHLTSDEDWGKFIYLGPLQYGQSRDITVPMNLPKDSGYYLEAVFSYPNMMSGKE